MRKHCGSDFEVLEREESTVTTLTTGTSYYAVAYGRHPGITEIYEYVFPMMRPSHDGYLGTIRMSIDSD